MTPQIVDAPAPETLRFGYGNTALGTILVAESAHGVVALFISDDRAKLLHDLDEAFPDTAFVLDQEGLVSTIAKAAARAWRWLSGMRCARFLRARHAPMAQSRATCR
jgi:AraC family transcriptional regulator of adaptative response/methylated-DNA-[protein]-cysteine methyltransferase